VDNIPITDNSEAMEAARKEAEAVEAQTKLFQGLKFFLGREVNSSNTFSSCKDCRKTNERLLNEKNGNFQVHIYG
jgi:hypothetical protein